MERSAAKLEQVWTHPGLLENYINGIAATKHEAIVKFMKMHLDHANSQVMFRQNGMCNPSATPGNLDSLGRCRKRTIEAPETT